jgi:hypothetical protein
MNSLYDGARARLGAVFDLPCERRHGELRHKHGRDELGCRRRLNRRKFIAASGTVLAAANGVFNENYWLAAFLSDRLDEHSGVRADLYANWFQSGSILTGDATAFGATASYYRNLTRHLSATAAVGINGIDRKAPLVDDWIASALVGGHCSF